MKYSLSWLNRYVDLSGVDVPELARRFTLSVAELEGVHEVGVGLERVVVARVESCERHPNADKLQVCQVNDGSGALRTVVCGAPNARPGLVTALALPGAAFGDFKIKLSKVRGVESAGMLCATDELGLGESHAGIWELPSAWPLGTPITELLPARDTLFEVDNKSITHRPDLWGHYGVARELAGLLGRPLRPALATNAEVPFGEGAPVGISVEDPEACPRYSALRFEGVRVGPSAPWMQALLHRCGMRAINSVVDATNFVMLELGTPLHAFDAREVRGDHIAVRRAAEGERVVTLDGQERALRASDLLICDAERPVALAGVMGLQNSEVRDDTSSLVLESANFRAEVVRRAAVRLGLRTEASARYEKSLDPALTALAARRFASLLVELCPTARVVSALGDAWPAPPAPITIRTSVSYINERLGVALPAAQVRGYLSGIEFAVRDLDGDAMEVGVPSFRATKDVAIQEDLVEEVGRLFGYDNITPAQPSAEIPKPYRHPDRTLHRKLKTTLSFKAGCYEAQGYAFDVEPFLDRVGRSPAPRLELKNPLSVEQRFLRTSLLPGLLAALERSAPHADSLKVYEVGRVFGVSAPGEELPPQPFHLGGVVWRAPKGAALRAPALGGASPEDSSYAEAKGLCELLAAELNATVTYRRVEGAAAARLPPWLHPARSGEARLRLRGGEERSLGFVGNLHPDVHTALSLSPYAAAFEWDLTPLAAADLTYGAYAPLSRFPAVSVDLSVIVPEAVTHDELRARMLEARWVRAARCVSVYRGAPVPEGQKSVSFELTFQAGETLEMEAVTKVVEKLTRRLGDELGGWVRA
ncbi:MAG: phenylalanine--tRNA ligase subunit beta [Deltaproteobacteria bacterium]|nr:phenylalanine--tRNA ligase subunit beta [Deltaproteobacteria bacterium]